MKTLILTAALALTASFAVAQEPAVKSNDEAVIEKSQIKAAVLQRADDEVTLLMEKEPRELVKIRMYDGNSLLYSQRVKKEATANITYDISAFPDGDYTLELVKDKKVVYVANITKGGNQITPQVSESLADKN
jgi:hypothetical protein